MEKKILAGDLIPGLRLTGTAFGHGSAGRVEVLVVEAVYLSGSVRRIKVVVRDVNSEDVAVRFLAPDKGLVLA